MYVTFIIMLSSSPNIMILFLDKDTDLNIRIGKLSLELRDYSNVFSE